MRIAGAGNSNRGIMRTRLSIIQEICKRDRSTLLITNHNIGVCGMRYKLPAFHHQIGLQQGAISRKQALRFIAFYNSWEQLLR